MTLDFNQLRELLTAIAQTDIAELTLKSADFELTVRKGIPLTASGAPSLSIAGGNTVSGLLSTSPPSATLPASLTPPPATATAEATPPPSVAATPTVDPKWIEVKSPMVGTFYRSPAPDEPAFVEVGDRIRTGQTICIIEAMKLMNEIEAEVSGQVMELLVQNGEPVEYDQPLMRINPG
ncbi:MAG TPA: acetyl-CoA carboxylase biotin carboxyl carrier protein [Stenomitos sp.]